MEAQFKSFNVENYKMLSIFSSYMQRQKILAMVPRNVTVVGDLAINSS